MSVPEYEPMLATSWRTPFDDPDWWFEVKWDGYRAILSSSEGRVRARSRRGLDLLGPFPELGRLQLPDGLAVDGEVVAFDEQGRPSFSLLQQRTGFGGTGTGAKVGVNFVAFDLLYQDRDLTRMPYRERRTALAELGLPSPAIVPEATPTTGVSLFEAAKEAGLEGVVAKRVESLYVPGKRSPDWRKIAVRHRLRAVVGGYLPGEGSRAATFGSVLVGLHDRDGLRWIAAVGSGFDESTLTAFSAALRQLERATSPFHNQVIIPGPGKPVWVEPGIVIDVEYKEWTHDDHLRAPVYKGIDISDPESITWVDEGPV
ncbi:MAG: non-homologous end-joining DNA ligase [Acidimicrobiia bacterium]